MTSTCAFLETRPALAQLHEALTLRTCLTRRPSRVFHIPASISQKDLASLSELHTLLSVRLAAVHLTETRMLEDSQTWPRATKPIVEFLRLLH